MKMLEQPLTLSLTASWRSARSSDGPVFQAMR